MANGPVSLTRMPQRPLRAFALLCCAAALWAISPELLAFVLPAPSASGRVATTSGHESPAQATSVPRAAMAVGSDSPAALAGMLALVSCAATAMARRWQTRVVRKAEAGGSLLSGALASIKRDEDEEAQMVEQGMSMGAQAGGSEGPMSDFFDKEINETDLKEYMTKVQAAEEDENELAKKAARQIVYKLAPSKQYVIYVAKKNAQKTWSKGEKNIGCLEVQIAIITEKIRNLVLHAREFRHDYSCRVKLVSAVSRRRRMLDKLSWKDLESYLKIRSELKIRHIYRMEALIGRLGEHKYGIRNRKPAPGRKVLNRLKRAKRLMTNRLATQLKQGKNRAVIHKTQKKITSRKWLARAYDDAEAMISNKEPSQYVDPLNLP